MSTSLTLCDRAFFLLRTRGPVPEGELLAHVYGAAVPSALRAKLAEPLASDSRLERQDDGMWCIRETPSVAGFTALAVVASGPSPHRARLVRIVALHDGERFDVLLNPGVRVPTYALERLGVEADVLESQPVFGDICESLERFLGQRRVLLQDAALTWGFIDAEARRAGRILSTPELVDMNRLATERLDLKGKPSLAVVAAQLGIPALDVKRPDEEARVLALAGERLLTSGAAEGATAGSGRVLLQGATAKALSDDAGVYVFRDAEQTPLYVGKARRLRSRMEAYIHRPLGATRRLEGLVGAVEAVDTTRCETDLEALVLEDREIRRLQPRFNTVRRQRSPRYWIRLPAQRVSARGRMLAPPRLELSFGPTAEDGDFVGPFRNEGLAEAVRGLAREVFELDALRAADVFVYRERLAQAWRFLHADTSLAELLARRSTSLLRKAVAFDLAPMLLPADPRVARYAVLRPAATGIEAFLIDQAVLAGWVVLDDDEDVFRFAHQLLEPRAPRTSADDRDVVLRWFGAQRPPTRLLHLPDDAQTAADIIETAALDLLEARAASRQDPFDSLF